MSAARDCWILGNFKQNLGCAAVAEHLQALSAASQELRQRLENLHIGIAPTSLALDRAAARRSQCEGSPKNPVRLLAQNVAAQEEGAFTGEIGAGMLREIGCDLAIIGHSERRKYYGEQDALLAQKVAVCAKAQLGVVLCVGESLQERDEGRHAQVVIQQLTAGLAQFPSESSTPLLVAYEPVWAIGTGRSASVQQAQEMHALIREELGRLQGERGHGRSILYGGSVKAGNAAQLVRAADIDGFLVGGASLDPTSFHAIAQVASEHLSS